MAKNDWRGTNRDIKWGQTNFIRESESKLVNFYISPEAFAPIKDQHVLLQPTAATTNTGRVAMKASSSSITEIHSYQGNVCQQYKMDGISACMSKGCKSIQDTKRGANAYHVAPNI